MFQKLKNMPIGVVASVLGAATLSNVYNLLGFTWLRDIFMVTAGVFACLGVLKVVFFFPKVQEEYKNPVFASLYATITMNFMLFTTYLVGLGVTAAKPVFFAVVFIHMALIAFFLFYHFVKNFNYDTFFPSIFVTLLGLLVSTVAGGALMPPALLQGIFFYGLCMYLVMGFFMVIRLLKKPIPAPAMHTKCILLAPCSLVFVTYLNIGASPALKNMVSPMYVLLLYVLVLITLVYIFYNTMQFFSVPFSPGFAGLTFPMAIGTLASWRAAQYFLKAQGYEFLGQFALNLTGLQIYITSAYIALVLFNFYRVYVDSFKKPAA